jgi:integrase
MEKGKADAQKIINDLGNDFSFEKFKDLFFGKREVLSRQAKFSDIVDEYLRSNSLSIQTERGYRTMLNRVGEFFPSLTIGDLSEKILLGFKNHLDEEISSSSISVYLRYIKAVWNFSVRCGIVSPKNNPFRGIKLASAVQRKRALSIDHLRLLKGYSTDDEKIQQAVDFFLFSFYCNGINFKDMLQLKFSNLHESLVVFKRSKTRSTISKNQPSIPAGISPELRTLLDKWSVAAADKDSYLFPFLDDTMDEMKRQRVIEQFIQTTNKRLAIVREELQIPLKLTTYVARHSFASIVAREIKSPFAIKGLLGHSSVQQTEIYIANIDSSVAEEAASILSAI